MNITDLKILSWNVWYDGQFDEISRFLASCNADILGLQEIVPDDPARDIIGFLRERGYEYAVASVRTIKDGRTMSNAIFSKYPILSKEIYALSDTDCRNALRTDIKIDEKILHIFSTHLLHTHQQPSETQELQAKNLLKILPKENTIVMGDFNATTESAAIQEIKKTMIDSDPLATPTTNPKFFDCSKCDSGVMSSIRLDYIFSSKDIKKNSFNVSSAKGSDHLPISISIAI